MLPPKRLLSAQGPARSGPDLVGAVGHALIDAVPPARTMLLGSLAWAILMAASAALKLWLEGWATADKIAMIAAVYALGGALAFPFGLYLTRLFSRGRSDAAFAAAFLGLATTTIAATAFVFAMHYRLYFATWHEHAFSIGWIFQFVFTTASAVYQFLVLGVRLFFPLGLAALFAAAIWQARAAR